MCLALQMKDAGWGPAGCRSCGTGICLRSPGAGCSSLSVFRALLALYQCIPKAHSIWEAASDLLPAKITKIT